MAHGTRLIYSEQFLLADDEGDEFVAAVRGVVQKWLANIRRYAELPKSRSGRLMRRGRGSLLLDWGPSSRRVVVLLLGLQAISGITFVLAAGGYALASLFF